MERKSSHPLYSIHSLMLNRCDCVTHPKYKHYGGRGITVCDRWRGPEGFENWLQDIGPRPEGTSITGKSLYSIERRDNNGNYEPGNCYWATREEQEKNRSNKAADGQHRVMMAVSIQASTHALLPELIEFYKAPNLSRMIDGMLIEYHKASKE